MAYAGLGRFLLKYADVILGGAYAVYTEAQRHEVATDFQARRCQVVIQRTAPEDVVVNTFDFVNVTSGEIDTTWTTADFAGVEARLRTFYAAISAYLSTVSSLREFRWSVLPNPPGEDNPAVRVAPPSTALTFTGSSQAVPQLACNVTKIVPLRRHWGRVALGPLGLGMAGTDGRVPTANVDAIAAAANTLVNGLQADDTPMIVFNRATGVGLAVEGVKVDNTMDVVRSRRFRTKTYSKQLP